MIRGRALLIKGCVLGCREVEDVKYVIVDSWL